MIVVTPSKTNIKKHGVTTNTDINIWKVVGDESGEKSDAVSYDGKMDLSPIKSRKIKPKYK